jgi:uracil-DNA glycosylase
MDADAIKKLKQLQTILAYHKTLGIDAYRNGNDIETFLDMRSAPLAYSPARDEKHSQTANTDLQKPKSLVSDDTIAELCEEISICQSCDLAKKRILPVCGNGGKKIRLFVVGSWLTVDKSKQASESIFGMEEDQMLAKMLAAINLSSEDSFVSSVIKCGIASTVQVQAVHIETCISFLERQIAVVSPDIICTMGTVATRALLKVKQPLSQLRGIFHDYRLNDNVTIPLMPTYHPNFLLKNPEMKRPTWSDLQQIQKMLRS